MRVKTRVTVKIFYLKEIEYTGEQLSRKWVETFGKRNIMIIVFIGKCNIAPEYIVDKEDLKNKCEIKSDKMVHFIIKFTNLKLPYIGIIQRLFISIIKDYIEKNKRVILERKGDDLYYLRKKLTISVATCARRRNEGYIHIGVNVTTKGTPDNVETTSLNELNIPHKKFAKDVSKAFGKEIVDIFNAASKVKTV